MFSKLNLSARSKTVLGLLILFTLMVLSFGLPKNSWAQGRLVIEPYLDVGWKYDSNFYFSDKKEKAADTYIVKPGLKFGYTTDKSLVSLDYYADIQRYDDHDDYKTNTSDDETAEGQDYVGHMATFSAQSQITHRLLIGLDNVFLKTRDAANSDVNSNGVARLKYTLNTFTPRVVYNFGDKFGMGLKYTNHLTDYTDEGKGEDSYEDRGTLNLFYYFNSKMSLDLDYQYWTRDYDKASIDYDTQQFLLNFNRQINFLTFSIGAGYQARSFGDNNAGVMDFETFIWNASVQGQNETNDRGIPRTSVYLALGSRYNDNGSGNSYYEARRLDVAVSHLIMDKLNCTLAGYFQNSDYENNSREDDRWHASLRLDYFINDFFTCGLEGGLEERDSNTAGKDFEKKYLMFNLKMDYDFAPK